MRNISNLSAAITLSVLLAACADGQTVEGVAGASSTCTRCHGGLDNQTGAPPSDTKGLAASDAVGAHTAHLTAGVRCDACHVVPTDVVFPKHQNGLADVTFGGLALAAGSNAAWNPSALTCASVYCHSRGGDVPAPAWNGNLGGQKCGACHPANGAYATSGVFSALHGVHRCATCHGESNPNVGCQACHTGYQRQLGATAPVVNAATHVDGLVEVAATSVPLLGGVTVHTAYDRTTRGCASDCHGIEGHGVRNPQVWE